MPVHDSYTLNLLIPEEGGPFMINGENRLSKSGHDNLGHRCVNNSRHFVIVNGMEACKTWLTPENHKCVLDSEEEKAKLRQVIKVAEVRVLKECVLSGNENAQHVGGGWKGSHGL